jgi:proteasome lid subunit RPN8/RPN11
LPSKPEVRAFGALAFAADAWDRLTAHCEGAYPEEACGALLGIESGAAAVVTDAKPLPNAALDRRRSYRLDPEDVCRLMRRERSGEAALLGFFHSHPDGRPSPSRTDRRLAWPGYHYLIVAIDGKGLLGVGEWSPRNVHTASAAG